MYVCLYVCMYMYIYIYIHIYISTLENYLLKEESEDRTKCVLFYSKILNLTPSSKLQLLSYFN